MILTYLRKIGAKVGLRAVGIAPVTDEVRAVFPWAESVICAAICYLPPESKPEDDKPRGLVARIARSSDYHQVLRGKLECLAEVIREEGGRTEVCVDTIPIPERKLAVLGGIGWRGWNGNVFVEGCGSWAALGEIVTNVRLPLSRPLEIDRCSNCGRCIRNCPTRAIVKPYLVDASRCLSQITQRPGNIPTDLRKLIGNRIYGCDVCQEVCPQNMGVKPTVPEFAEDRFPGGWPEIVPLIRLNNREFRDVVKPSSIGWIGRTRIRRNAVIAAGNLRCEEAIAVLQEITNNDNPIISDCARWALAETKQRFA